MQDSSASTGRYRSLFTLAKGGMGRIDVAQRRESGFERLVAIKRLHDPFAEDHDLVTMLLDEARVAGTIRHAHVVSVLDVGRDEDGPFLVMDLVEGQSLAQVLARAGGDGLLPLQVGLRILRQVAAGLHAAHETRDARGEPLRVVHRDVSPQNVLVGYDGVARITDFGIAKALGAGTQTAAGLVKGKLRYMAPEQLTFGSVDRRTDLFALGVVAFEMITGRRPFRGTPEEIARAIVGGETPDLGEECPELPSALVELVFRLLARDPELRPRDADEVGRLLDAVIAAEVAREGAIEVADYLSTCFEDTRKELSKRIRDAVEHAAEEDAPETVSAGTDPSVIVVESGPPGSAPALEPEPGRRSRQLAWVAAGAVVLGGVVAATVAGTRASMEPSSRDLPPASAPAPRPPAEASVEERAGPSAGASADSEDTSADSEDTSADTTADTRSRPPPSTRPTREPRRAPRRDRRGPGAWSWEHGE